MELGTYVDAVYADLAAVTAAGPEEQTDAARRLAAALGPALRLRLLEAISDAARELSAGLTDARVEVTLQDGDPSLVLVQDEPADTAPAAGDETLSARITLRLPEPLKGRVEAAAARDGVSVNTWLVQAIARSVDRRPRAPRGLSGFARS